MSATRSADRGTCTDTTSLSVVSLTASQYPTLGASTTPAVAQTHSGATLSKSMIMTLRAMAISAVAITILTWITSSRKRTWENVEGLVLHARGAGAGQRAASGAG